MWATQVRAWVVGQAASEFVYDSSSDFGTGQSGLYSDRTSVTFDDFTANDGTVRDSLVPRFVGPANTSISSGTLRVQSDDRGGEAIVDNFTDADYMVQVWLGAVDETSEVWFRYQDSNNGYLVRWGKPAKATLDLYVVENGERTSLWSGSYLMEYFLCLGRMLNPWGRVEVMLAHVMGPRPPTVAVRENRNSMRNDLGTPPRKADQLHVVENNREAAVVISVLWARTVQKSGRRPSAPTVVACKALAEERTASPPSAASANAIGDPDAKPGGGPL